MKKVSIIIIVILFIILIIQLGYYNFNRETNMIENDVTVSINTNNINEINEIMQNINQEESVKFEEVIAPYGIANFSINYKGDINIIILEHALYKFIYTDSKTINDETTGKSTNYIQQYYDTHTEEINNMGIYSAEDFSGISRQINLLALNDEYESSEINTSSYEETEDGYTSFQLTLKYESGRNVELLVYIANNSTTQPNIKFSSAE